MEETHLSVRPQRRVSLAAGLRTEVLGAGVLVLDPPSGRLHRLSGEAASRVGALVEAGGGWVPDDELTAALLGAGILAARDRPSRRQVLGMAAAGGGLVALGIVTSALPSAAQAQSVNPNLPVPSAVAATALDGASDVSWVEPVAAPLGFDEGLVAPMSTYTYDVFNRVANPSAPLEWVYAGTTGGSSFRVTGLTNGVEYEFAVATVSGTARSELSDAASATPALQAPAAPVALEVTEATSATLEVAWLAGPVDPANSAADSYTLTWGLASGGDTTSVSGLTSTSRVVPNLTNAETYRFVVEATNTAGTSSESVEARGVPVGANEFAPRVPTPVGPVTAVTTTATTATITVDGTAGATYETSTNGGASWDVQSTNPFTISGLSTTTDEVTTLNVRKTAGSTVTGAVIDLVRRSLSFSSDDVALFINPLGDARIAEVDLDLHGAQGGRGGRDYGQVGSNSQRPARIITTVGLDANETLLFAVGRGGQGGVCNQGNGAVAAVGGTNPLGAGLYAGGLGGLPGISGTSGGGGGGGAASVVYRAATDTFIVAGGGGGGGGAGCAGGYDNYAPWQDGLPDGTNGGQGKQAYFGSAGDGGGGGGGGGGVVGGRGGSADGTPCGEDAGRQGDDGVSSGGGISAPPVDLDPGTPESTTGRAGTGLDGIAEITYQEIDDIRSV